MIVHFKESSSPSPGLASWQRLWSTVQRPRGRVSWTYGTPQAIGWLGGAGGLRIQNGDGGAWADMKPNSTPALMLLHSDTETHGKTHPQLGDVALTQKPAPASSQRVWLHKGARQLETAVAAACAACVSRPTQAAKAVGLPAHRKIG